MASLRSSRVPSFMLMHTVYKTHGGPPHGADKIKALCVGTLRGPKNKITRQIKNTDKLKPLI